MVAKHSHLILRFAPKNRQKSGTFLPEPDLNPDLQKWPDLPDPDSGTEGSTSHIDRLTETSGL